MTKHLSESGFVDALDGVAEGATRAHLQDCPECSERLRRVAESLALAADARIPEPPSLYWTTFRRKLDRRLAEDRDRRRRWSFRIPALALATAALAAVAFLPPGSREGLHPTPEPRLPAWSAAVVAADQESLARLRVLADSEEDWTAASAGLDWTYALSDLSDEESRALAAAFEREMGESSS
ncbi:MAG TPA: hypothetical protein VIC87_13355 [Vicinamibacteria bacterium]|jgi:anti-sigma factor RsiW